MACSFFGYLAFQEIWGYLCFLYLGVVAMAWGIYFIFELLVLEGSVFTSRFEFQQALRP